MKKTTSFLRAFFYSLIFSNLFCAVALVFFYRYSVQDIVYLLKAETGNLCLLYAGLVTVSLFLLAVLWLTRRYLARYACVSYPLNRRARRVSPVLWGVGVLLVAIAAWLEFNIPNDDPNSVIFTLAVPMKGTDKTLIVRSLTEVPLYILFFALSTLYFLYPIRKAFHVRRNAALAVGASALFCLASLLYFGCLLHPVLYATTFKRGMVKPIPSAFYQTEYVNPRQVVVSFPEKKKNLLFILMESIESSFLSVDEGGLMDENCLPNLTRLANDHLNFSHRDRRVGGGDDVLGTNWTVAGMVAKSAGIPLHLPLFFDPVKSGSLLPNAVNLTTLLSEQGYTCRYLLGSDKHFACRDLFWECHGGVEMHDYPYLKATGKIPKDYRVFWGIEDTKLYALAKEELNGLSAEKKPFFFGMLTVDTHFPNGFVCPACPPVERNGKRLAPDEYRPIEQYKAVLKCADRQIADFLAWCSRQSWYDDTLIVIMGDHLFMNTERDSIFPFFVARSDKMKERRWFDLFIHSELEASENRRYRRQFSSFDMFPTVLEAMGVRIEGRALGLGRSLFSNQPTLLEKMGKTKLNEALSYRTEEYETFLEVPKPEAAMGPLGLEPRTGGL